MKISQYATLIVILSSPQVASASDISKIALSGEKTMMWSYHSHNKDCQTSYGLVKVVSKPQHGVVSHRLTNAHVDKDHYGRVITNKCAGAPIKGFEVDYRSVQGFHGTDTFTLDVTWNAGSKREIDNFTVNVR
jgi:hypothetical protein